MKQAAFAVIVMALATPAVAQDRPPVVLQAPTQADSLAELYRLRAQLEAQRAAEAQDRAVGALVADGQCEQARRYALQAGRFDLAQQVDAICKPPAPPVK